MSSNQYSILDTLLYSSGDRNFVGGIGIFASQIKLVSFAEHDLDSEFLPLEKVENVVKETFERQQHAAPSSAPWAAGHYSSNFRLWRLYSFGRVHHPNPRLSAE